MSEKKILVPIDFSDISKPMVRFADEWAIRKGATLYLLHAESDLTYRFIDPAVQNVFHTNDEEIANRIREQMRELVKSQKVTAPHEFLIREGKPYKEILKAQKEYDIDLIIMGAHDHREVGRLFVGSNTDHVLHHVHCSVFVYKEAAA